MKKSFQVERREAITKAAIELIANEGMEALTTRKLARSMSCSIGTLSYYYKDKNDLVTDAFQVSLKQIVSRLKVVIRRRPMSLDHLESLMLNALPLDNETDTYWRVHQHFSVYALSKSEVSEQLREFTLKGQHWLEGALLSLQRSGDIESHINTTELSGQIMDWFLGLGNNLLFWPLSERSEKIPEVYHLAPRLMVA